MIEREHLVECLAIYHSVEWVNQHFNLVKHLLMDFNIKKDGPGWYLPCRIIVV